MNAIATCNPLRDFGFLPGRLFNLTETLFGESAGNVRKWSPAADVTEDENSFQISADLPDVAVSDVKVVFRDGVLTISGERKQETKTEGVRHHLIERTHGTFHRSFRLPKEADGEKVAAEFKNGVLLVTVPKREEVKPREIEVKVK